MKLVRGNNLCTHRLDFIYGNAIKIFKYQFFTFYNIFSLKFDFNEIWKIFPTKYNTYFKNNVNNNAAL